MGRLFRGVSGTINLDRIHRHPVFTQDTGDAAPEIGLVELLGEGRWNCPTLVLAPDAPAIDGAGAPAEPPLPRLRIVVWNIHHGEGLDGRVDVRINMTGVVSMLGSRAWPIAPREPLKITVRPACSMMTEPPPPPGRRTLGAAGSPM